MSEKDNDKNTILIVDDVPENIDILNEILKKEYRVKVAINGEKALKIVNGEHPPDLVLLDIMMPGIDGYEVCRRLKESPETDSIPIIFVTAKSDEADESLGFSLGGVDYITKPISPPIVLARVKAHIALKNARSKLEAQNRELVEAAQLREDVERITRHDLKSPLNAIIGYPELIAMEDNLNENQQEWLKTIEDSGKRMLQMINLSLDLFKMERGLYQTNSVPLDLIDVIHRVERELAAIFRMKQLQLVYQPEITGKKFIINGEELLCYSLFSNLLKNSAEASPDHCDIVLHFEDSVRKQVSIRNMGSVPVEIQDRFFEKFSTSGKENGTGLGTYSAKLLTEVMGGSIQLDTSKTGFTSIHLIFP